MAFGDSPSWVTKGKKPPKKKAPPKREVKGPYRDQSSVPEIKAKATKREHRKVVVRKKKPPAPFKVPRTLSAGYSNKAKVGNSSDGPDLTPVLNAIKKTYEGSPITDNPATKYARDQVDTAVQAVKDTLDVENKITHPAGTGAQQATAANIVGLVSGGGAGSKATTALEEAATNAGTAKTAAKLAEKAAAKLKAAPKKKVARIKSAPKRAATRVKETPNRVRTAPARAKKAASTPAGRRAVAKGAGRKAAKHPVRTGYGAALAVPSGTVPGDVGDRARAFAEGSFNALTNHPGETLKTTARALPAAVVGPVELGAAAVESAVHGTPKPLVETAKDQAEGISQIVSTAFSGDPKKAEMAARKEGSLSLLTPIPALSRTPVGKLARDEVRGASSALRRKVATTGKLPAKDWRNRKIRHAPKGTEEHATALLDRHHTRKRTAEAWQRIRNKHAVPADRHAGKILDSLAKSPKGSHIALQTLAEYGIRDAKGADLIRKQGPGDAALIAALDYVDLHPEVFKDKHVGEALKRSDEAVANQPAAEAQLGERARLIPQGDALGVTRPEHVVPVHKRETFGATTWAEAATRLKELRKRQRKALAEAPVWGKAVIEADLKRTEKMLKEAKKGAKRKANVRARSQIITTPDGTKRKVKIQEKPYGDAELKEYVDRVETARKAAGLEKAIWTRHSKADSEKGVELNLGPTAAKKEYAREGRLAREDNLDRSLEGFIRGTIQAPLYNAANKEFLAHIAENEAVKGLKLDGKPFELGRGSKDWKRLTARKSKENPDGGQIDPKSFTRFPLRQWEHAVGDPFKTDAQRSEHMVQILKAAREDRVQANEPWIPVRREALKEAEGQINANHNEFVKFINSGNRAASRALLATNPAWLLAQTVAEAVPAVVSHPSLASPAHLPVLLRRIYKERKENPSQAMAVQASAGASPINGRYLNTPIDQEGVMTPETWSKGAEGMTQRKSLKSVVSFAKLRTLPEMDVHRQNLYRELVYRAEADRKFRKWHSGVTGLFDGAAAISKKFKGKSDRELQEWLQSADPEAKRWNKQITDHVDAIQGNWGAFTRFEKSAAPFIIFYPFLRYSLRWALWSFPREHPVRATVLAMMGQANANQIEKLVGHPLENPSQYAEPLYTTASGEKATLPGGQRISPSQSSITQAAATGNPATLAQALNPVLGAGATGVFGVDTFTGEKIRGESNAEAALNDLLSLPLPLRLAGVQLGGEPSPGSKAFGRYNQNKELRSLVPFVPQSEKEFKGEQRLGKAFNDKYANPVPSLPSEIWEAVYNKDWKRAKELRAQRVRAEKAGDIVKAAEKPFLPEDGGEFDDEMAEILKYITGTVQISAEPEEEEGGSKYGSSNKYSSGNKYAGGNKYSSGNKYGGG